MRHVQTLCVALRIAPNSPVPSNAVINYTITIRLLNYQCCVQVKNVNISKDNIVIISLAFLIRHFWSYQISVENYHHLDQGFRGLCQFLKGPDYKPITPYTIQNHTILARVWQGCDDVLITITSNSHRSAAYQRGVCPPDTVMVCKGSRDRNLSRAGRVSLSISIFPLLILTNHLSLLWAATRELGLTC